MTKGQRITLMAEWWPAACRAQGWADTRAKRLEVLSAAVGRVITSANDLNNTDDMDRVVAHLAALASKLAPVVKHETLGEDRAVRLRFVLRGKVSALGKLMGAVEASNYLAKIIRDKFGRTLNIDQLSGDRPPGFGTNKRTGATYPLPSQLDQVLMVISRAVAAREPREELEPVEAVTDPDSCPF